MSYTEYLRRKASGEAKILDTRKTTDASMYIHEKRLKASREFALDVKKGVINNTFDVNTDPSKKPVSYTKLNGGKIPDASFFTAYSGSWQIADKTGKILMNSDDPSSISGCTVIPPPVPAKSAGDWLRDQQTTCCVADGAELPTAFVDNTIRLKHLVGCCDNEITKANHEHPADVPFAAWSPRAPKDAPRVLVPPSPSDARKVGDFHPRKLPYVERKHGNDLNVNPRRVPTKYQIPNYVIPHLKINDAFPLGCNTCGRGECSGCNRAPQLFEGELILNEIGFNEASFPGCIGDTYKYQYVNRTGSNQRLTAVTGPLGDYTPGSITVIINNTPISDSLQPGFFVLENIDVQDGESVDIQVTVTGCLSSPLGFLVSDQPFP